jgi:protoheme ferro-lyase
VTSVEELYDQSVKALPVAQRLRLATMILNDIPPQSVIDYSEDWSGEDYRDFTRASWQHVEAAVGGSDDG